MLEIYHCVWSPKHRKFCIWSEVEKKLSHPNLEECVFSAVSLLLPTQKGKVLPSSIICRKLGIDYPEDITWNVKRVACCCIDMKTLYDLDIREGVQLSYDFSFWKGMVNKIMEIVKNDWYFPAVSQKKKECGLHGIQTFRQLSEYMPEVCRHVDGVSYDKQSILQHFFDDSINIIISKIPLPNTLCKKIDSTLLGNCLGISDYKVSSKELEEWKRWKSFLERTEHSISFQLESPEGDDEEWKMNIFVNEEGNSKKKTLCGKKLEKLFIRSGACSKNMARARISLFQRRSELSCNV